MLYRHRAHVVNLVLNVIFVAFIGAVWFVGSLIANLPIFN